MADSLTPEMVHRVARLARLKLSDAEVATLTGQLGQVLDYVSQLDDLNLDGVESMVHAVEVANVFRTDELTPSLPREDALANAPRSDGRYFLVPPILDEKA